MFSRSLVLVPLLVAAGAVFAQGELPPKMQGQWKASASGALGPTMIEVVRVQGPDKVDVKVTMIDVAARPPTAAGTRCSFTEAAVAERQSDAWKVQVQSQRCASFKLNIKWVQGKRRFEGDFSNDAGTTGSIFYEWIE